MYICMMTTKELFDIYLNSLQKTVDRQEATAAALYAMEGLHAIHRNDIYVHPEKMVEVDRDKLEADLSKLSEYYPIQYLVGRTEFYARPFLVREGILIPRPETEELIHLIVRSEHNPSPSILDIGCGSGAIAVSLAAEVAGSRVEGCDISPTALQTSNENAALNEVTAAFWECDILQCEALPRRYDIIVSNPPYVLPSEKQQMRENVLRYEPELALFTPENKPLLFYDKIASLAAKSLSDRGLLFFEINEQFGNATKDMLLGYGFSGVEVIKDINGKDRIAKGVWTR